MRRTRKHLEPMCDVLEMSATTAKQRLTTKTTTLRARSRVPQVFYVAAHIVWFRVVLRVDLVLRVVNGVRRCDRPLNLYPKFLHISHRENGTFEVLSLHLHDKIRLIRYLSLGLVACPNYCDGGTK